MRRGERLLSNRMLEFLAPRDLALIEARLEAVDLPLRRRLEIRGRRIDHVYFLDSGIASVVASDSNKNSIEVGLIGREGVTGIAVIMGTDRAPHEVYMQIAGAGWRIKVADLRRQMEESASLRQALLNFAHVFAVQTAHTALANGRANIEERLARWLLMAQDRVLSDQLPLTHEFLALMLGVRRPGVTVALKLLEKSGFIGGSRGVITVLDRDGLKQRASGAYGAPEAELRRLFE